MAATKRSASTGRRARTPSAAELDRPLPARQDRSQATTERLLEAAESLLREGGPDDATLRAIADRAGVSLGIVYRRFRDKDAVLRAVYTRFFERVAATNARSLDSSAARLANATVAQASAALVSGIAEGYRSHRPLLRALVLYARTHPSADFRKRAAALNSDAYHGMQRLFEAQAVHVTAARREKAVRFAISAVAAVLQEQILFGDSSAKLELTHSELLAEATEMMTAYLGKSFGQSSS
jgi:AcrR family transcriptional regulator